MVSLLYLCKAKMTAIQIWYSVCAHSPAPPSIYTICRYTTQKPSWNTSSLSHFRNLHVWKQ